MAANSDPLVSVIIPHYNGIGILKECLDSLSRTSYPAKEIIVVDNASTDGSEQFVSGHYPYVRLIRLDRNLGFAGGCNTGIRAARGDLVCILNNDTTHDPLWLDRLVDLLLSSEEVAVVQPKILSSGDRTLFDYSGACGGLIDIFGYPFARGRIFETIEADEGQYDQVRDIFWASGTAFLAKKAILLQAGLFDDRFFAHMEEIDLQWRLHLLGKSVKVEPGAVVYHHSGYTLGAESFLKKYLNHRNNLFMILANYSGWMLSFIFPVRILLEWMSLVSSLIRGDWSRSAAILRSMLWILTHIHLIVKKRRVTRSCRRLSDRSVMRKMYRGSLPIDYYIFGKKTSIDLPV
jgi:GT2 family glycosyltransferase